MSGPITPPLTVETVDGATEGRPITTIKVSNGDLTISGNEATIDTSGSGGTAAPADAEYLLAFDASIPSELTAARKLTIGGNISFTHGAGANDDVEIKAVPSSTGVSVDGQIQYCYEATDKVFVGEEAFYFDTANTRLHITGGEVDADVLRIGSGTSGNAVTTNTTEDLILNTNTGTNSGSITITNGVNGSIDITPNGSGLVKVSNLSVAGNYSLPTDAGTDTYVMTTDGVGGVTWAEAGSGGGGSTVNLINTTLDSGGTPCDTYTVTTQYPYGANTVVTGTNKYTTTFIPFIAPKSGDVSEIGRENTSTTSGVVSDFIGVYSTNSTDYTPQTLLGFGTFDSATAAIQYDTSLSATITLVGGSMYWLGFTNDSTTDSCQFKMVNYFYRSTFWPDTALMVTNGGSAWLSSTGNETALAASYSASGLTAGINSAAMPHVSLVIG